MSKSTARMAKRNPYAAPIGGIFIILCIIGFVTLVVASFNFTRSLLDNSAQKAQYEKMLLPVVMFDPVPFDEVKNFDPLSLLQTCIWATLLGENRDAYQYDDGGMLVIPASDVEVTAARLFGPDAKLEHQTFGNFEDSYLYDRDIKSYHVPVTVVTGFVTPRVTEISKKGDVITLKVGYVPPSSVFQLGRDRDEIELVKFMIYELHKAPRGGDYYLYAIRDVAGGNLPGGNGASYIPLPDELSQGSSIEEFLPPPPGIPGEGGSSSGSSSEPPKDEDLPEEENQEQENQQSQPPVSSQPVEG